MIENSLATPASCQAKIFNSSQINPSFTTFRKKTFYFMGKKVQMWQVPLFKITFSISFCKCFEEMQNNGGLFLQKFSILEE